MTRSDAGARSAPGDAGDVADALRRIPPVNEVVASPALDPWRERVPRALLVHAAQAVLAGHRAAIAAANGRIAPPSAHALAERAAGRLEAGARPPLAPVINATGIIIHTGLGRAPLAEEAIVALADVAGRYAPVEIDVESGERGRRSALVRDLLCELTGAESATVVNNCAAALVVALSALARGRPVVVSRGELIEIGGSFRLPDVMATGGAILREIGTTNKTRLRDYERAIDDGTGALLKVHPSNYRLEGFTAEVSIAALAKLGHDRGVPVIHDVGSGALVDLDAYGVSGEPSVRASIEAGADLVLFSGDKLLGGPQAGVIVGRGALIERIENDPMMRAVRLDKLILAALAVTLQLHRDPGLAARRVPVLALVNVPVEELDARAKRLVERFHGLPVEARSERATAYVGGGSLPTHGVPSAAVVLRAPDVGETELARRLRGGRVPIIPRLQGGAVWLDLRTVFPREDDDLFEGVRAALADAAGND